jgi:hypothetical protein
LHLLEKLLPVERAVFLLRDVFDYPYDEVARIVGKSPDNCRQILARAHRHVQGTSTAAARRPPSRRRWWVRSAWRKPSSVGDARRVSTASYTRVAVVNGEPGLVFYVPDGRAAWVAGLEIADGVVVAVRSVLNPDKLAHVAGRPRQERGAPQYGFR